MADYEKAAMSEKGEPDETHNDPPPSYDSVFGNIRKARDTAGSKPEMVKNVGMAIFCGTVCNLIVITLLLAIPIANIVIGAIFLDDCPIQRLIPIYLVVSGAFGIVGALFRVLKQVRSRKNNDDEQKQRANPIEMIVQLFLIIWFICGCVWVYGIHKQVNFRYDPAPPQTNTTMFQPTNATMMTTTTESQQFPYELYCHQTLYLYAFWIITISFIIIGCALLLCCCIPCVMMCIAKFTDQ